MSQMVTIFRCIMCVQVLSIFCGENLPQVSGFTLSTIFQFKYGAVKALAHAATWWFSIFVEINSARSVSHLGLFFRIHIITSLRPFISIKIWILEAILFNINSILIFIIMILNVNHCQFVDFISLFLAFIFLYGFFFFCKLFHVVVKP